MVFDVTYVGEPCYRFYKNISRLILKVSNVKVRPIYRTFEVGNNLKLKSYTPLPLVSNVVYRFIRLRNTGKHTYVCHPNIRSPG